MRVILLKPLQEPEVCELDDSPNSLEAMQKIVRGRMEAIYPFQDETAAIIVNADGADDHLPQNRMLVVDHMPVDRIFGPAIICGSGLEGEDFVDLTEGEVERIMARISNVAIWC